MNKSLVKSFGAIIAGFAVGAILSIGTDFLLDSLGVMSMENFQSSPSIIIFLVIAYRFVFNMLGSYITASLSPNNAMKHALILGAIGLLLSIIGAIVRWEQSVPSYNITIPIISIPSAWLGGKLFINKTEPVGKRKLV